MGADTLRYRSIPLTHGSSAMPAVGFGPLVSESPAIKHGAGNLAGAGVRRLDRGEGPSNDDSPITSRNGVHESLTARVAEADGKLSRAPERPKSDHPGATPRKTLRERLRRPLLIVFPAILVLAGAAYYLAEEPYVTTDDAFVRAAKESVNARVGGQVIDVAVKDNQQVQRGQLLFSIDPEPYQIAVDQAEARLASARLQIDALKATYRQQKADLESANDSADYDQREYGRKKALVTPGWTPREVFDRTETDLKVARHHIASIEQQIANTVANLNGDPNIDVDRHPSVRAAKAQLDSARLDLSYTVVKAPDDGIVARVDDLQVGDFVNTGAAVFSLMSSQRIWVEANFRETGLTHMRAGQKAVINVDAYPDRTFKAHVVSMSPGAGSDFSVLPPENATGNWVKVVQRLPVRLEFDKIDPSRPLFSGISVTARVDTGYRRNWRHPLQFVFAAETVK
jgi:membrane fusion protein (multidrug efflux system)